MTQDELRKLSSLKKQDAKNLILEKLKFIGITKEFNFKNFNQMLPEFQCFSIPLLEQSIDNGHTTLEYTCYYSEHEYDNKLVVELAKTYPLSGQASCFLYKFTVNEILKEL
jgi:hypothetical protein